MAGKYSPGKILLASAAAYAIANIGWWVQPSLVHEVMERYGVKESAAGMVASAEMTAIALASVLFARGLGRFSFSLIAMTGVALTLTGAAASIFVDEYAQLLIARALTGTGEGALLAIATASLASFEEPDKAYGKINVFAIVVGSVAVFSLPVTSALFDYQHNVFPSLLFGALLLSFLVPLVSASEDREGVRHTRTSRPDHAVFAPRLISLSIGTFMVSVTAGAMWSFYYVLGDRAGLSEGQIDNAVGVAALLSVSGAALATILGTRFGRLVPVFAGVAVLTLAIACMAHWHQPLIFRICAVLNVAGTYFLFPYFLGYAAAGDQTGRDAAIVAGVFLLTGALGPALGGLIIEALGVESIGLIVMISNTLALALFVRLNRADIDVRPATANSLQGEVT